MNRCPSCGGDLRYDIKEKCLVCGSCRNTFEPAEYDRFYSREDAGKYQVNMLTCPGCGAEILAADNSAAEYCSFCGSFVMLESRSGSEDFPDNIIPFQYTKEECKEIYRRKLRRHIFAPSALRRAEYLNRFSGMYIPYWVYDVGFSRQPRVTAKTETRQGDYVYTKRYQLTGDMEADYDGIVYDASSTFDDNISEKIGPFDTSQLRPFSPSYLFGFFADTADVPGDVYEQDARVLAADNVMDKLAMENGISSYDLERPSSDSARAKAAGAYIKQQRTALLPVWFLTWRKKNRVAYSVVNGETGKLYAEVPVEIWKFLLGAVILSIPLYFLMDALLTFVAADAMFYSCLLCTASFILYHRQLKSIVDKYNKKGDRGYLNQSGIREKRIENRVSIGEKVGNSVRQELKDLKRNPLGTIIISVIILWLMFYTFAALGTAGVIAVTKFPHGLWYAVMLLVLFFLGRSVRRKGEEGQVKHALLAGAGPFAALIICMVTELLDPVADYPYYLGAIAALLGTAATLIASIVRYNLSVTREVPHFFTKAKEERSV